MYNDVGPVKVAGNAFNCPDDPAFQAHGARAGATPICYSPLTILPILAGYAWVLVATFSQRTNGLLPRDAQGNLGGLTLENWQFLAEPRCLEGDVKLFSASA